MDRLPVDTWTDAGGRVVLNASLCGCCIIPASCFTHPEISTVGLRGNRGAALARPGRAATCLLRFQPAARAKGEEEGFEVSVAKTSFKANSKALAEVEGDGMAKMIYRADTGEMLGVHIIGPHAADLIHEASNAIATAQTVQDIRFAVHAHPTLSEVVEELYRSAKVGNHGSGAAHAPLRSVAA